LSWPNPTAEKIWVFSDIDMDKKRHYGGGGGGGGMTDSDGENLGSPNYREESHLENNATNNTTNVTNESQATSQWVNRTTSGKQAQDKTVLETYNLTVDNMNGYQLKFDDMNWSINMNGLKPLVISLFFLKKISRF
jgi:hypothetical protein